MIILKVIAISTLLAHLADVIWKSLTILKDNRKAHRSVQQHGFTVIICAHNELKNLKKNLPFVLQQDYQNFEVIVVLDRSDDDSYEFLQQYFETYPFLKAITINRAPEDYHPKKYAITKAIELSSYEWILLTDADCSPSSLQWIESFNKCIEPSTDCIIGVSPYHNNGGLLGSFISYECHQTALSYISASLQKRPYMGVGRNLAYRKDAFFKVDGFKDIKHIVGGDDDLLVQRIANSKNCTTNLSEQSFTFSEPKRNWNGYLKQKTRHLSVGKYYLPSVKIKLFASNAIHSCMWMSNIILFSFNPVHSPIAIAFALALVVTGLFSRAVSRRASMRWNPIFFPIMDMMYALGLPLIGLRSILIKRVRWN